MAKGDGVTLKLWHDGLFQMNNNGMGYVSKCYKTVKFNPDEFCWLSLVEEAEKCGSYKRNVDSLFYMSSGITFEDGLKKVDDDKGVRVMCDIALERRVVDCYIVLHSDAKHLTQMLKGSIKPRQRVNMVGKLTPRRKTTAKKGSSKASKPLFTLKQVPPLSTNDFNDITVADIFNELDEIADAECAKYSVNPTYDAFSDDEDPSYELELEESCSDDFNLSDLDLVNEEVVDEEWVDEQGVIVEGVDDGDTVEHLFEEDIEDSTDDEELQQAREKLKEWNKNVINVAKQLQAEAAAGSLQGQEKGSHIEEQEGHVSEYDESGEEEETPGESEDDSRPGRRKKASLTVVDEKTNFAKLKWCVGIRFPNRASFKDCVIRYAVAQGRNLKFDISEKDRGQRLRVRCLAGCPFRLYASWERKRACFIVKSVDPEHTCLRNMESNRQLKSTWVAKQLLEMFKARPHWPASEIMETVRRAYKVIIKKDYAYKVKYHAHKLLHGSMKEHYSKVGSYLAALEEGNPSSVFKLFTTQSIPSNPTTFQRFFVCFEALKQGWLVGCRKLLCVDSCFLKTFLGGQLISAVGRDANEQMFPLAWAVVEGENNDSYEWFFQELKKCIGEKDGNKWTIISDEHPSIISMVAKELPMAEHRHCARHIFANWHKTYRGDEMKMLFWNCAKAYNVADFNDALDAMRQVDPFAVEAFLACDTKLFCRAFIKTHTQNDVIVNNMAETFNAYIINARTKHLIHMLEDIRSALMERMFKKRKEMEARTGLLCPRVQERLDKEKDESAKCFVTPSSNTTFQVRHIMDVLNVDIEAKTCTCRKWDLTGIPCCHGVAAIFCTNAHAENYVNDQYMRDAYLRAYNGTISPCVGERHWPKMDFPLNPPPIKVGPGRPRKNRRKDPFEDPKKKGKLTRHGQEMSCSVCKSKTHNKRKCPDKDKVQPPPPKRKPGDQGLVEIMT